jgi:hypothetical protein
MEKEIFQNPNLQGTAAHGEKRCRKPNLQGTAARRERNISKSKSTGNSCT